MVLPRLIHPVKITIEPWAMSETIYDDDFREPISQAKRSASKEINGQPRWTTKDSVSYNSGGAVLQSTGFVLFRYVDLNSKNYTPKRQDRITSIGHMSVELYVVSSIPCAHYTDQNGAAFLKVYFSDMNPGKV